MEENIIIHREHLRDSDAAQWKALMMQLNPDASQLSWTWARRITSQEGVMVVTARDRGRDDCLVGMAQLDFHFKQCDRVGWIDDVVVDTAYRRRGIAARLMEEVLAIAREHNLTYVTLSSNKPGAVALYKKMGFREPPTTFFSYTL